MQATSEHDLGLISLASGDYHRAAQLLGALERPAPVNRPVAWLETVCRRWAPGLRGGRLATAGW